MMNAVCFQSIDNPTPTIISVPIPIPKPNEVVVKIKAASINHRDEWIRKGQYARMQWPVFPGSDGAGIVTSVGEEVNSYVIGNSVIIDPTLVWGDNPLAQSENFSVLGMPTHGTFAEFVAVPATHIHELPSHLTFEQAACLPIAGATVFRSLFTQANVTKQSTVFITGIGGGVALTALQFLVAFGARVFVSSSSQEKLHKAIELGATGGVLYTEKDWHKQLLSMSGGIDVVIDGAGGDAFNSLITITKPGGTIVSYGATNGEVSNFSLPKLFWKQIRLQGTTMSTNEEFANMVSFVREHRIVPVIHSVFPFNNIEEAFAEFQSGAHFGKVVLSIS
jgi:NADPH:quinone reductase-like Zn-dependent oxidoreductase